MADGEHGELERRSRREEGSHRGLPASTRRRAIQPDGPRAPPRAGRSAKASGRRPGEGRRGSTPRGTAAPIPHQREQGPRGGRGHEQRQRGEGGREAERAGGDGTGEGEHRGHRQGDDVHRPADDGDAVEGAGDQRHRRQGDRGAGGADAEERLPELARLRVATRGTAPGPGEPAGTHARSRGARRISASTAVKLSWSDRSRTEAGSTTRSRPAASASVFSPSVCRWSARPARTSESISAERTAGGCVPVKTT